MHDTDERKENNKGDVGSERRSVTVKTPVDGASVEIARRVRAKGVLRVDGIVVRHVVGWLVFSERVICMNDQVSLLLKLC